MKEIYVAKKGDADFRTIQSAIDSIRVFPLDSITIHVANGVYFEKVMIPDTKPNICIQGESKGSTIISFDDYAEMRDESGQKLGTFRTATFTNYADNVQLENITIQNTAGHGKDIGQALALYLAGDCCTVRNVALLGNQDTLFTSKGRHYFRNCIIKGDVDFIFGAATVLFADCEIYSIRSGYIVAPSTPKEKEFGYVFLNCKLTGTAEKNTVYLGRPWRPYAHTVFIKCELGEHIKKEGWDNWRNIENEKTARFAEYGNTGFGAPTEERVRWSKLLNAEEGKLLTMESIFKGNPTWLPLDL